MIYLGLGSNQGDRRAFLSRAIERLTNHGFEIYKISPVVESPALLKRDALSEWNRPYLNLVIEGDTTHSPEETLRLAKSIEQDLGRDLNASRWSPRYIDIDILLWHDQQIDLPELTVPHTEMHKRSFVITPLLHLSPHLILPGINLSPLQISQQIRPIPLWMGVVNATPDSFSRGNSEDSFPLLEEQLEEWIVEGVNIIDVGGESTRPGADGLSEAREWRRLEPVFKLLEELREKHTLMPLISVDTRHYEVAQRALHCGADWINDVTGLTDKRMLALIRGTNCGAVAMHSLGVPVQAERVMGDGQTVDQQLLDWLTEKQESWQAAGLDTGNIVFDPGIGFGKTALQNIEIVKHTARLRAQGFRLLIGHSRKSFMSNYSAKDFSQRDMETLGLSLAMCEQGVDIIRVHDPLSHIRAYRAWAQAR
jgi:2-amino-4-hydroxy-6-hydroxymethyldihydropteridine diphosphokinase/dihydropteroate synthase